jgi:hypothetical protein
MPSVQSTASGGRCIIIVRSAIFRSHAGEVGELESKQVDESRLSSASGDPLGMLLVRLGQLQPRLQQRFQLGVLGVGNQRAIPGRR